MAIEIERRFLVLPSWQAKTPGTHMLQAYVAGGAATVRVRLTAQKAWLTVKGVNPGMSRPEFEYSIPLADAEAMAALPNVVSLCKARHLEVDPVQPDAPFFEVDVYEGSLAGLVIAEVELQSEDQEFFRPAWLGLEITGDKSYSNESLAKFGFPGAPL